MFLQRFDIFCDLSLNRPKATWNLFVLYRMIGTVFQPITVQGFSLVQAFFKSQMLLLSSPLFFCFILLIYSFFEKFFSVFTCSIKQKNGENILQNSESLVVMTHIGNCCENFLQFRHSQVIKNSFCLHFSIFLLCKQLLLNFLPGFHLLINLKLSHKYFQNRLPCFCKTKKTSFL